MGLIVPTEEKWLPIARLDKFEVSSLGRVRYAATGKIKPASLARSGYWVVNLYAYGLSSVRNVHAVVAEAFLGPQPFGHIIEHCDADKANNRASNLCYVPRSGRLLPRMKPSATADIPSRIDQKLEADQVHEILDRLDEGQQVVAVAHDYHVSAPHVSLIKHRRKWRNLASRD